MAAPHRWIAAACAVAGMGCLGAGVAIAGSAAGSLLAAGSVVLAATAGRSAVHARRMRGVDPGLAARPQAILRQLCEENGVAAPRLEVVAGTAPRAYSTRFAGAGVIGCSTGMLEALDDRQLRAILGHELSHHLRRDSLRELPASIPEMAALGYCGAVIIGGLATGGLSVVSLAAGNILMWGTRAVRTAVSRSHERAADAAATALTGDPEGLASALNRIDIVLRPRAQTGRQPDWLDRVGNVLLEGHPPTPQRVTRLLVQAHRAGTLSGPSVSAMSRPLIPPAARSRAGRPIELIGRSPGAPERDIQ
jgi:heat shock protein HtpX